MSLFLQRIDSAPITGNDFTVDFDSWVTVLVDTLNSLLQDIEDAFNNLSASSYTSAEIAAMAADLPNGILLYDTDLNVYVGKESGALVKFTTTSYP